MSRRAKLDGKFTVSGPYEDEHPVDNPGMGMSCALTFANRHREKAEEVTYYVRDLLGTAYARVTKHLDGVITTTTLKPW